MITRSFKNQKQTHEFNESIYQHTQDILPGDRNIKMKSIWTTKELSMSNKKYSGKLAKDLGEEERVFELEDKSLGIF